MRDHLVILILLCLLSATCARRPPGNDVVVNGNSMSRSTSVPGKIVSAPGAAQAPAELQFIDTTIQLQLTAIDAEQLVATRAQHAELKQLARETITDQQRKIASLRQLRAAWFGDAGPAVNVDLPDVQNGIQGLDLEKLDLLKEKAFDLEFIRQLIPLYEAIAAISSGSGKETHPELKQLAEELANQQKSKIEQMKNWQTEWE
jgi:uncharacterized protein (DUF305 family)